MSTWKCPRCTLENESTDSKCKMCDIERPPRVAADIENDNNTSATTTSMMMMQEQEASPFGSKGGPTHQLNQHDGEEEDAFQKANQDIMTAVKGAGEDGATVNARIQEEEKKKAEEKKKQKEEDAKASNARFQEENEKLLAFVHGSNDPAAAAATTSSSAVAATSTGASTGTSYQPSQQFSPKEGESSNLPTPSSTNTNNNNPTTTTTTTTGGGGGGYPDVPSNPYSPPAGAGGNNNHNNHNSSYPLVGTVLGATAAGGALGFVAGTVSSNNNNNNNNNINKDPQPQAGPGEWVCPTCTLINKMTLSRCDVCGAKNPLGEAMGPWTKYELKQDEYDHLVACFFRFLGGNSVDDRMGRTEVTKLCRFLNFAHTDEQITNLFREMDKDRSGKLSCDEFVSWCASHRPDPQSLYGLSQPEYHGVLFSVDKYDRDHDGFLTPSECIAMLMDKGFAQTLDQAHVMTQFVDADHDGKITLHEILVAHAEMKKNGRLGPR